MPNLWTLAYSNCIQIIQHFISVTRNIAGRKGFIADYDLEWSVESTWKRITHQFLHLHQVFSVYCNFLITLFWNAEYSEREGQKNLVHFCSVLKVSNTAWPLIYPKISSWELTLCNIRSIAGYGRNAKQPICVNYNLEILLIKYHDAIKTTSSFSAISNYSLLRIVIICLGVSCISGICFLSFDTLFHSYLPPPLKLKTKTEHTINFIGF